MEPRRFIFPTMKNAFAVIVTTLAVGAVQAGVLATMKSVSSPPDGQRRYDPLTLNPTDLKSCLVDAYSIDTADAIFEVERPKVEEARAELHRLREASRGKPTKDTAAAESELRAKAREFNARVASLNSRVAYAQEARDRFSKVCKDRRYYVDDLGTVRRQLPREIRDIVPVARD